MNYHYLQVIFDKRKDIDGIFFENSNKGLYKNNISNTNNFLEISNSNNNESMICLIACHFCKNEFKQKILMNNLKYLYHLFDKIVIIYSTDVNANDLLFDCSFKERRTKIM